MVSFHPVITYFNGGAIPSQFCECLQLVNIVLQMFLNSNLLFAKWRRKCQPCNAGGHLIVPTTPFLKDFPFVTCCNPKIEILLKTEIKPILPKSIVYFFTKFYPVGALNLRMDLQSAQILSSNFNCR